MSVESDISLQTSPPDLEWFPRLRCMSLNTEEAENTEQNEIKELRDQLNETSVVVKQLSSQLSDLRDRVSCLVRCPGLKRMQEWWKRCPV